MSTEKNIEKKAANDFSISTNEGQLQPDHTSVISSANDVPNSLNNIQDVAKFPEENPFPVLRLNVDGTILYCNPPGQIFLKQWNCKIGQKAPENWSNVIAKVLKSGHYLLQEVCCDEQIFSVAVAPVAEKDYVNLYGQDITARRKAELSLHLIRKDLEEAQKVGNIGSWRLNLHTNELIWSDQNHLIFGIPKGTPLTYQSFLSTVHPEDRDLTDRAWKAALTGEPYDIQHRIIVNGTTKWVHEKAYLEFDASGELIGGFGISQDITDRKKSEEALNNLNQTLEKRVQKRTAELTAANEKLSSQAELIELAHDTIIIHDLNGIISFWNHGAEKTYGWTKQEAVGKNINRLLKTQFDQPLIKIITTASSKGVWEGLLTRTTKTGDNITVESRWALETDKNGEAVAILQIDRDITQRRIAEKKNQEARIFSESIVETIQEALVVLDPKLKVISANSTFYDFFSLSPRHAMGQYIYQLAQNQWDITKLKELLEDILPQNTSFKEYEMKYRNPQGHQNYLLLNARRIYKKKQKTKMILLSIQDITALKQREHEIRDLTEQLLLAEEQQRQKIATILHDSIGQILAFSSRELATLEKQCDDTIARSIKNIRSEIFNAIQETRQLTADLSSPTLNTFGLEAGIEELGEEFSEKHGFMCHVESKGSFTEVPKKAVLVFYHAARELLYNIAKHAKARNVHVYLDRVDHRLHLRIQDDGKGFDVAAFELSDSRKNHFGLFSIRQRLTNLGGTFTIESEKNRGTTVILETPLLEKEKGH